MARRQVKDKGTIDVDSVVRRIESRRYDNPSTPHGCPWNQLIIVDAGVVAIATRGLLFAVSPARGLWIGANRKFCFYARKGAKVCYLRVRSFSGPIFQCMKGSVSITPLMRELSLRLAEQGSKKNPKGLYPQLLARVTVNELRKLEPCFGSIRRHVKLNAPLSKSEKEWLERERAIN